MTGKIQTDQASMLRHLTPIELSKSLGISASTLAHYRCSGKGPEFIKIGRRVFYDEDAIKRWLRDHSFKSTADEKARQR